MAIESFYCESIYGAHTQQPLVKISVNLDDHIHVVQISPDNARELAMNLLQCAESADMDAIVVKFLTEKLHQPIETAARILIDFREVRKDLNESAE